MYYFAFGSTLEEKELFTWCPEARFVGNALLDDYQFLINELGSATVIHADSSLVYGVVWDISDAEMVALDRVEGVDKQCAFRETVSVHLNRATLGKVFIHISSNSTPGIPEENYIDGIIEAAIGYCFPPEYIEQLRRWKKKKK